MLRRTSVKQRLQSSSFSLLTRSTRAASTNIIIRVSCFVLWIYPTGVNTLMTHDVRRSARLASLSSYTRTCSLQGFSEQQKKKSSAAKLVKKRLSSRAADCATSNKKPHSFLPRGRERELLIDRHVVFGVDEAGRGPLAGPVVAAAAWIPTDILGIIDSKLITREEERERIFGLLTQSPGALWTAAIVDAATIDEINILQASLLAMKMASDALHQLLLSTTTTHEDSNNNTNAQAITSLLTLKPSAKRMGCYVVGGIRSNDNSTSANEEEGRKNSLVSTSSRTYYALVDGQHTPKNMPCSAESIIKGDSKEYCIAAASIVAKVTRDRIMREYANDVLFKEYNFAQHKGYATKQHMEAITKHGPSSIHRRTFQPIKGMLLIDTTEIKQS